MYGPIIIIRALRIEGNVVETWKTSKLQMLIEILKLPFVVVEISKKAHSNIYGKG